MMEFPFAGSELKRSDGRRGSVNHLSGRCRWGLSLGLKRPGLEADQSPCSAVAQNIYGYNFMLSPYNFKVNHFYLPINALNCIKLSRLKSTFYRISCAVHTVV